MVVRAIELWPWPDLGQTFALHIDSSYLTFVGFKRYRADTKYSHTMLNTELWPWPWTDFGQTYVLHIDSLYLTFVSSYLKILSGVQKI